MRMEGPYPGSEYDPEQCPFWPRRLRQAGYTTAQIGKWHTGTDTGHGRDWDHQAVWNRPAHPNNAGKYYGPQLMSFNGAPSEMVDGYSTDNYTDWAVDFIENKQHGRFLPEGRDPDKPWYLWLCYGAVHGPSTPADRHLQDYEGSTTPVPVDIFGPRPTKPPYLRERTRFTKDDQGQPDGFDAMVRKYNRCVRALDEGVGRLVDALRQSGQLDNTIVIYTSDQGFAWGQHGLREKWAPYDAALRAPLIVSLPGRFPEGAVCPTPVGGVDLIPTLLRLADVEPPWPMHGNDLTPLLQDPRSDWPHPVMIAQTNRIYGSATSPLPTGEAVYHRGLPWYVSLTQGRYKYIRYTAEGEGEEFYDLQSDPEELHNRIADPHHAEDVSRYRTALLDELKRTNAPFLESMPPVAAK
jgi:arylsulfatase A-like enzyme